MSFNSCGLTSPFSGSAAREHRRTGCPTLLYLVMHFGGGKKGGGGWLEMGCGRFLECSQDQVSKPQLFLDGKHNDGKMGGSTKPS